MLNRIARTYCAWMTTLGSSAVTYDTHRRIDSLTTPDGVGDFTYDGTGQLLDADYDFQTDEAFTYDLTGNRTMTGYSTGDDNQLLSDGTFNYTYDNEGNRTRKTTISSGDYVDYSWDHRNRLTTVTFRDSSNTKTKEIFYTYDVWNRRLRRQLDSNGNGTIDETANLVYDAGVKPGLEDLLFVFDGSNQLQHRFFQGPNVDQPLTDEQSSGVDWLLAGHLGTISDVAEYNSGTDTTTVVNHLTYTSYGDIASQTNSAKAPYYSYTAREFDADAELFYYRARWYDAVIGRFISEDPIGFESQDMNLFRYVVNSPIMIDDPNGYQSKYPRAGGWTPGFGPRPRPIGSDANDPWDGADIPGDLIPSNETIYLCQRDINENADCSYIANACGGQHQYIQFGRTNTDGTAKEGTTGVGFSGGTVIPGETLPSEERAFKPSRCTELVMPKGTTFEEAKKCIENYPIQKHYATFSYNCTHWAAQAIQHCGLKKGTKYKYK